MEAGVLQRGLDYMPHPAPEGISGAAARLDQSDFHAGVLQGRGHETVPPAYIEQHPVGREVIDHSPQTIQAVLEPVACVFDLEAAFVSLVRIGDRRGCAGPPQAVMPL